MTEAITGLAPEGAVEDDRLMPLNARQAGDLSRDGFLAIPDMTDPDDIAFIRGLIEPILNDPALAARTTVRDMAKGDAGPVREIITITDLEPRLMESRFYKRAYRITEALFGGKPQLKFDHVIDKPAHSNKATDWHQDLAYSSRVTMSAKRLHWWLPLRAVDEASGCMQFVAGSHLGPVQKHWAASEDGHVKATSGPAGRPTVCNLPLGGATIHLPKTLHYSGPNISDRARTAWIIQLGVTSWPTLL